MNSARRWPSAKPTRNPHGVKEKEVLFFEGEFPQLHSISFLFPIFYLNLPPTPLSIFQTHIFSIFLISLSNPPHIPLRASRTENSFSLQLYFPLFRNLKRLVCFGSFCDFLLSSSIDCIGAWSISHREFRSTMSNLIAW